MVYTLANFVVYLFTFFENTIIIIIMIEYYDNYDSYFSLGSAASWTL